MTTGNFGPCSDGGGEVKAGMDVGRGVKDDVLGSDAIGARRGRSYARAGRPAYCTPAPALAGLGVGTRYGGVSPLAPRPAAADHIRERLSPRAYIQISIGSIQIESLTTFPVTVSKQTSSWMDMSYVPSGRKESIDAELVIRRNQSESVHLSSPIMWLVE